MEYQGIHSFLVHLIQNKISKKFSINDEPIRLFSFKINKLPMMIVNGNNFICLFSQISQISCYDANLPPSGEMFKS